MNTAMISAFIQERLHEHHESNFKRFSTKRAFVLAWN